MRINFPLFFLTLTLLTACSGYEVSFNDNVVYTPKPLLADVEVADRNLELCIVQTIKDEKITALAQLTRLRCTHAGIQSLQGLERFYAISELDLSDNTLINIEPIGRLGKLTTLVLDNNQIENGEPLLRLLKLTDLNLAENPGMQCAELTKVAQQVNANGGQTQLPEHCQG